jgi:hypothetical protein
MSPRHQGATKATGKKIRHGESAGGDREASERNGSLAMSTGAQGIAFENPDRSKIRRAMAVWP